MCGDRVINRTRILAETDRVIDAPEEHVAPSCLGTSRSIQLPFCKRDEYVRTHSESSEA
jgi:hypothetical protein